MTRTKIRRFERDDHILVVNVTTGDHWKEPKSGPGPIRKAVNFTKAVTKHVGSGRKKASPEVIQKRFKKCTNCPDELFVQLDPAKLPKRLKNVEGVVGTCTHSKCGCYLHGEESFPNKLAWATTRCPRKYWGTA